MKSSTRRTIKTKTKKIIGTKEESPLTLHIADHIQNQSRPIQQMLTLSFYKDKPKSLASLNKHARLSQNWQKNNKN